VKGATAIIASLGFLAAANKGHSGISESQALVEVKNDYSSFVEPNFDKDFDFVHTDMKILPPATFESLQFSLDDTYLNYDVRDSYLQRQATPFAN